MTVTLRPITTADEPFLYRLYASTREDELAITGWTELQKAAFLQMQFDAQHRYYHETWPHTSFQLIVQDDAPIGRLYVRREPDEIRIVDIAFLPEHRRRGLGSALLRELIEEATAKRVPLTIHVEKTNPAFGLYERLGFAQAADRDVYWFLSWTPPR